MNDKRIKSAEIIQRNFRKYLERRKVSCNTNKLGNCRNIGRNQNNEVSHIPPKIHEIYIELNKFYTNLPANNDKLKHQDDISQHINEIIDKLSQISKLDDCKDLNAENITEEARLKHQEALNNLTVKWWQNLNDH